MAVFSIGTGSFEFLLAMPLAASACAILAGALLAVLRHREDIDGKNICGIDERDLDILADTLSHQLRSVSAEPVSASAPKSAFNEKRSA